MIRILDVGCGTDTAFKAAPRGFVNCDVGRPRASILNFVRCDARELPFRDTSFDYVSMYNVLEHITNYERALIEALRVAKSGVIVRVDGLLTMRNLLSSDHKYITLGMGFTKTTSWLEKIRRWKVFDPRERTTKRGYRIAYRIILGAFKMVLLVRYLGFSRSWHYYLVTGNGYKKLRCDFLSSLSSVG